MLDMKANQTIKSEFKLLTSKYKREDALSLFDLGKPKESVRYNPLLRGSGTELKDKFMLTFNWSEEYYKKKAESFMLIVFNAVAKIRDKKGVLLTLNDVLNLLIDPDNILSLCGQLPSQSENLINDLNVLHEQLSGFKEERKSLAGLKTDIEVMVKSTLGPMICSNDSIDIADIIENEKVLLLSLDGQRFGSTAARIARLLVADIRSYSGEVISSIDDFTPPEFTLMIDEFADVVSTKEFGEVFTNLLNRSRSSGIGCIISHQSIGDFEDERIKSQIIDNTETTFCFLQKDSDTAEKVARMIGTRQIFKSTYRHKKELFYSKNTGDSSVRETEEFIIHPNRIKDLSLGECAYFAKKPNRSGILNVNHIKEPKVKSSRSKKNLVGFRKQYAPYSKVVLPGSESGLTTTEKNNNLENQYDNSTDLECESTRYVVNKVASTLTLGRADR